VNATVGLCVEHYCDHKHQVVEREGIFLKFSRKERNLEFNV